MHYIIAEVLLHLECVLGAHGMQHTSKRHVKINEIPPAFF